MSDFMQNLTAAMAEPAAAAPPAEPAAPAPAADQAPATAAPAAEDPAAPAVDLAPAKTEPMTRARHKQLMAEQARTYNDFKTSTEARIAELEAKLAQAGAAANPQEAAPKADETEEDWLARLTGEGAEVHPEIAKVLGKLNKRFDEMDARFKPTESHFRAAADREDNARFDDGMGKILEACPGMTKRQLLDQLAAFPDGEKDVVGKIIANHQDMREIVTNQMIADGWAKGAAPSTAPRNTPVPQIGAAGVPGKAEAHEYGSISDLTSSLLRH